MLQMFARTVRLVGVVTPSEGRLLGIVSVTIVGLIFLSTLVDPPHWLQVVALFFHLIFLVVGFGSVLAVDWYGLLSLSRRVTIGDVLLTAERMTPLIWIGLAGLTASGVLLKPNLSSWLVVVKLVLCGWRGHRRRTRVVDEPCHGASNASPATIIDPPGHGARRRLTNVLVDGGHHRFSNQSGGWLSGLGWVG